MTLRNGDRLWRAFVHVSPTRIEPEIRPQRVVQDGRSLRIYDEQSGESAVIEDGSEELSDVYCLTEAEAWGACEIGFRRVAAECLQHAAECGNRKEVARGLA